MTMGTKCLTFLFHIAALDKISPPHPSLFLFVECPTLPVGWVVVALCDNGRAIDPAQSLLSIGSYMDAWLTIVAIVLHRWENTEECHWLGWLTVHAMCPRCPCFVQCPVIRRKWSFISKDDIVTLSRTGILLPECLPACFLACGWAYRCRRVDNIRWCWPGSLIAIWFPMRYPCTLLPPSVFFSLSLCYFRSGMFLPGCFWTGAKHCLVGLFAEVSSLCFYCYFDNE